MYCTTATGWQPNCSLTNIHRVSQEERTKLQEGVPYVKLYRYNPKHLCPKLSGFRDNGKWSLKLWQLLHTYWLSNSCWNWQEYVVSVMLISVLNIKVTLSDIKALNWTTKTLALMSWLSLGLPSTVHSAWISAVMKHYLIALGGACAGTEMRTALLFQVNALHSCRRTIRGNARCPHFSLAIISVTVQLWI